LLAHGVQVNTFCFTSHSKTFVVKEIFSSACVLFFAPVSESEYVGEEEVLQNKEQ
jgi:hypothetical protein